MKRDVRVWMVYGRYGDLPAHEMLADFNLLVFLASLESLKVLCTIKNIV